MIKQHLNFSTLEVFYLSLFIVLFMTVFAVPHLIQDNVALTSELIVDEEIFESALLTLLLSLSLVLSYLYKREYDKQQKLVKAFQNENKSTMDKLTSAFKYIGKINVQLEEIKSILITTGCIPRHEMTSRNHSCFSVNAYSEL